MPADDTSGVAVVAENCRIAAGVFIFCALFFHQQSFPALLDAMDIEVRNFSISKASWRCWTRW